MNQRPFISNQLNIFDENRCVFSPSIIAGQPVMISQEQNRKVCDSLTTAIASNQPRNPCFCASPCINQPLWSCPLQAQKQGIPGGVVFNFSQPNYCCPPSCIPSAYNSPPEPCPQVVECPHKTPQSICIDFGKFGMEAMAFQQKCRQQCQGFTYDKQVGTNDQVIFPKSNTCCCGVQSVTLTAEQKEDLFRGIDETSSKSKLKICACDPPENRRCCCFPRPNPNKYGSAKNLVIGERKERSCWDYDIVDQAAREADAEAYLCCDCLDKWKKENEKRRPSCLKKRCECLCQEQEKVKDVTFCFRGETLEISEEKKVQSTFQDPPPQQCEIQEIDAINRICLCNQDKSVVVKEINEMKKKRKGIYRMAKNFRLIAKGFIEQLDKDIDRCREMYSLRKNGTAEKENFVKSNQYEYLFDDAEFAALERQEVENSFGNKRNEMNIIATAESNRCKLETEFNELNISPKATSKAREDVDAIPEKSNELEKPILTEVKADLTDNRNLKFDDTATQEYNYSDGDEDRDFSLNAEKNFNEEGETPIVSSNATENQLEKDLSKKNQEKTGKSTDHRESMDRKNISLNSEDEKNIQMELEQNLEKTKIIYAEMETTGSSQMSSDLKKLDCDEEQYSNNIIEFNVEDGLFKEKEVRENDENEMKEISLMDTDNLEVHEVDENFDSNSVDDGCFKGKEVRENDENGIAQISRLDTDNLKVHEVDRNTELNSVEEMAFEQSRDKSPNAKVVNENPILDSKNPQKYKQKCRNKCFRRDKENVMTKEKVNEETLDKNIVIPSLENSDQIHHFPNDESNQSSKNCKVTDTGHLSHEIGSTNSNKKDLKQPADHVSFSALPSTSKDEKDEFIMINRKIQCGSGRHSTSSTQTSNANEEDNICGESDCCKKILKYILDHSNDEKKGSVCKIGEIEEELCKCCECDVECGKCYKSSEKADFKPCLPERNSLSTFGRMISNVYSSTMERASNIFNYITGRTCSIGQPFYENPAIITNRNGCDASCYDTRIKRYFSELDKPRNICPCRMNTNRFCGNTCYDAYTNRWYSCCRGFSDEQKVVKITFKENAEKRTIRLENNCRNSRYHVVYE